MAEPTHRYLAQKTKIRGHIRRIGVGLGVMLVAVIFALCVEIYTIVTYYSPGLQAKDIATISSTRVDPRQDGKLVYLTGKVIGQGVLRDPLFGVQESALALERHVQMYQWAEDKAGASYHQTWLENLQSSSAFKVPEGHANPSKMPYMTKRFIAPKASIGAFEIAPKDLMQIMNTTSYPVSDEQYARMHPMLKEYFSIQNGHYYFGKDPNVPNVGDTRISYTIMRPVHISMVGVQRDKRIVPHIFASTGKPMVEIGQVPLEEFMETPSSVPPIAQATTWILRLVGFVVMFYSIRHITIPLRRLSYLSPGMERMFSRGNILIASMGSVVLFSIVVALCWGVHYPLWGVSGAGVLITLLGIYILKHQKRI